MNTDQTAPLSGVGAYCLCSILYYNSGTSQHLYDVRLITLVARQHHLSVTLILYNMY